MLLFLLLIFVTSIGLTAVIRHYALVRNVLDIPNQRSSHTLPTPRGGGLAVVLAFVGTALSLYFTQQLNLERLLVILMALPVALIGFLDDHRPIAARWRFATHLLSALAVLWILKGIPAVWIPSPLDAILQRVLINLNDLGYPLGILFLVWLLNLFNFMDGTDGIAASEAVFVASVLAGYLFYIDQTLFQLNLALVSAALGFLVWNWPKAKIFMGDVGSGFLGFVLGILILLAAQQAAVLLYCGLIVFGLFIVDASYTLIVRVLTGQKWYDAHCSHTYQRVAKVYGHLRLLQCCWAINLLWLLPMSLLVFLHPASAGYGLILAYLPLLILAYHFKAGLA